MKIVIDVHEVIYNRFVAGFANENDARLIETMFKQGIVLPEGHGRLIDADDLREDFKASKKISFAERMDISCIVDHATTIIEADKTESVIEDERY